MIHQACEVLSTFHLFSYFTRFVRIDTTCWRQRFFRCLPHLSTSCPWLVSLWTCRAVPLRSLASRSRYYNLLARTIRAGFVFKLYRRGPHFGIVVPVQNCRRYFLVRCESGATVFLARLWPVLVRVRSGLGLWVGLVLRPYLNPTRMMQYVNNLPPLRSLLTYCKRSSLGGQRLVHGAATNILGTRKS